MFTTVFSAAVYGLQAYLVRVEVDLAGRLPSFQLVGSLGSEVKESRERVSVAMKNSGFQIPPAHITVNLAPAGRRKDGTAFDLPVAVGLLRDMELVPEEALQDTLFLGELGLNGEIKKVKGVLGCQFAGSQLQVIIGQNVPKVLAEFVAISGVKQGEAVDENLDAPKEKFELKNLPNIILDYLSGSMTQLIPLLMAGGLFRTIAAVLGPTMLGVLSADDPTYTFLYTTLYEATFTFIPIYLGYAAAKKLGASPVLGMLLGGALMAPSVVSVATQEGGGIISVYGIQIAAANYQQSVLPIILSVPVLYFVEKFFKKVMPDVLSTVFTPFCTMIVTIPIAFIVLAPIGNEIGTLIANALFGLADLGGIGILIVMAVLGAFWQLFVV